MSVISTEDRADGGPSGDDEALKILDQLDADNERYMLVNIELRDLLEDAVTREVALERRVDSLLADVASGLAEVESLCRERDALRGELAAARAELVAARADNDSLRSEIGDLRAQLGRVDAEIEALNNTKLMRAAAPLRAFYARLRRVHG